MSGTDDLFPDATEHPGVPVPVSSVPRAGVAYGAASGAAPAVVAPSVVAPRRGLGIAALILGILAILGDLIGIIVAFIALAGAVTHVGETLNNVDNSLGTFIGLIVLEFAVFFGGIVFGLIAVILGLIAAIRRRGRVPGIFGVVFGALVIITHVALAVVISSSGNVPGISS